MRSKSGALARKSKGRGRHIPSPANFVNHDSNKDKHSDWRAQLLTQRHRIPHAIAGLVLALHFGEAIHA